MCELKYFAFLKQRKDKQKIMCQRCGDQSSDIKDGLCQSCCDELQEEQYLQEERYLQEEFYRYLADK